MAILRTDIERALDELTSQEEGMRFQGLAVVLGKKRWPELIAHERKKDLGLDAYAPPSLTKIGIGKGLAASISSTQNKIVSDLETAKNHFPELRELLFVTPGKVGTTDRKRWGEKIQKNLGVELHIIAREDIISEMMMPENASLCASFLNIISDNVPDVADLINRIKRAANSVTQNWACKTKGHQLIDLTSTKLDSNGKESLEVMSLDQIEQALWQGNRIVLEGPAGRGKTTTLIQLAKRVRAVGISFIVELSSWTSTRKSILEYIAGMPAFQAECLTVSDLARVQQIEPFLFLLNGWNEIAESSSVQANNALRELELDFPSTGIIVATRAHHLAPPLPGAMRLRLLPLRREQRATYLAARLGNTCAELCTRIDANPSLDELTLTPFILSEVASLFDAGAETPSTKIGILDQVLRLQEQRDEHRNALQVAPIFSRQTDYLKAIATEMTRRGAVALREDDARAVIAIVARDLAHHGQIEAAGAPGVLATLTAHHVLERIDYPETTFQFEHQQLQEFYAALDVRARFLDLLDDDQSATISFAADYVNDLAWAEPLRMIAETFAELTSNDETNRRNTCAGVKLVTIALTVDLVFAGELAQLCGAAVWNKVSATVSTSFRAVYASCDGSFRQYALAAMIASGSDDFSDIIVPLLSEQDQQIRLNTYRLWPDIHVSSLGQNWRERVRGWSVEARKDFVSELLFHRFNTEIATFAKEDESLAVKEAAASGLMWTASEDALSLFLESIDTETFENVVLQHADLIPVTLIPKAIAILWNLLDRTTDQLARMKIALDLVNLREIGLDRVIKDALATLSRNNRDNLDSRFVRKALEYLHQTDPEWTSEWITTQIPEGSLRGYEYWISLITKIPHDLVAKYLKRLETEEFKDRQFEGIIIVIAACANDSLAALIFNKLQELHPKKGTEPVQQHKFEQKAKNQLVALFRRLPDDVAVAGILLSVTRGDCLDIKIATDLLSRVARSGVEPLQIANDNLKTQLRYYLKSSIDLVLLQDDFNGEQKANLISSLAQVGNHEDMADLMKLINADINRIRRGRAARDAGERGPISNGSIMSYADWNITAIMNLDSDSARQVIIDLLPEPEYLTAATTAMKRDFLSESGISSNWRSRFDMMWAIREGLITLPGDEKLRTKYATALISEIERLKEEDDSGKFTGRMKILAEALSAIDGLNSAGLVLDVIAMPSDQYQYVCLQATEFLLMSGVFLPSTTVFEMIDSFLVTKMQWMESSDKNFLSRLLALCPFIDNPDEGLAKIRDVLNKVRLRGYELQKLVIALGESRLNTAIDLLEEIASDDLTFRQCEEAFIDAFAVLDSPRALDLLLGFVNPDIRGITTRLSQHEELLVRRLAEIARSRPEVEAQLLELCEYDLPEHNRCTLAKVMGWLGTTKALIANLNLIDDAKPSPIPRGIWTQLETAFWELRPYFPDSYNIKEHAQARNKLRSQLFRMAHLDAKRRKSASMLLGQIEIWRLEHGRPIGEPRHPDLAAVGKSWPPKEL